MKGHVGSPLRPRHQEEVVYPSVAEILSIPHAHTLIPESSTSMMAYLGSNITDIIEFCLSDNEDISKKAFLVLLAVPPQTISYTHFHTTLLSRATEILSTDNVSDSKLGRLASLLQYTITTFNNYFDCCGILFQLVKYIDKYFILEVFKTISEPNPVYSEVQDTLHEAEFGNFILKQLDNSTNDDYRENILQLISVMAKNVHLSKPFETDEAAKKILNCIQTGSQKVKQSGFTAAKAIVTRDNFYVIADAYEEAVHVLNEMYLQIMPLHIEALDFVTNLLKVNQNMADIIKKSQFLSILLRLFAQFENSSNTIGAIFHFLRATLTIDSLADDALEIFLQPIISEVKTPRRTAASAFGIQFLMDLLKMRDYHPIIKEKIEKSFGADQKIKYFIEKYEKLLKSPYGGVVKGKPSVFTKGKVID